MAKEHAEQKETVAMSDCESISDEVGYQHEVQESADFDSEGKDLDDEQDESEDVVMSIVYELINLLESKSQRFGLRQIEASNIHEIV